MQFKFTFVAIAALFASSVVAVPAITETNYAAREANELAARQDGSCTFADGSPAIPNGGKGCNGLGLGGNIIQCNNGAISTVEECGFGFCKDNGDHCGFFS